MTTDALDHLAQQWAIAKEKEEAARDVRLFVENEILKLRPAKDEGSETFYTPNGVKIVTTGKLSYKVDIEKLTALTGSWPAEARPFKTKIEADETKLKVIRNESPTIWSQIAEAITVTPAKTGFKIEFKE